MQTMAIHHRVGPSRQRGIPVRGLWRRSLRVPAKGLAVGLAVGGIGLLSCPTGSQAALLRYAASGTGISGSLAGEAFSDAAWEVFVNADSDHVQQLMIPTGPMQQIDAWLLKPVAPSLHLTWAGGQRSVRLGANSPFGWSILSGIFPTGPSPKIGFVYANPNFSVEHAAGLVSLPFSPVPSLFNNLQQPVALASPFGIFETSTYPTDGGDLIISTANTQPGTFRIAPVPAPLPLLAVGSALGWARQLRRRGRRPSASRSR